MRLLYLDSPGITKLLESLDNECEMIKRTAIKFAWYMRGGVSYNDIMNMSVKEREEIAKLIDENLETTKKTQLPFF